ncbi:MAG: putative phage abortive infection protein [Prevotella sp.]|nr:putative phage abortive infection protein [Prevotella sp.]MBO5156321.1 putative phage abortive infection protein [Prevotella sp.]
MEGPIKTNKSKIIRSLNWLRCHTFEIVAIIILLIGTIFFSIHRDYDKSQPIDGSLWGQYGDYIGGLVGTLLAYISIKLLNRNLQEQILANKMLRESNEDSRTVAALQQFESSFSTLIEMYHRVQEKVKGLDMKWANDYTSTTKSYDVRVKTAINKYSEFYRSNFSLLSSYYRLLYRIMQTIDDAKVDEETKRRYSKIFRCQITEEELLLLRYNAATNYGKKMQIYINRYNLLKHLPKMHLLEFKEPSILSMVNGQEELFDHIFMEARKQFAESFSGILPNVTSENILHEIEAKKIILPNFEILLYISMSVVRIELVYVMSRGAKVKLSDTTLKLLLNFFILETFVYSSYECYQTLSSVEMKSDIKTEKGAHRYTVWTQLENKDNYTLVFGTNQLNKPQK